jgi:hypothetical protein
MQTNDFDIALSILETHKNKLPFVVAEYFFRLFGNQIITPLKIKYDIFFKPFLDFRKYVIYEFELINSNDDNLKFIRFKNITFLNDTHKNKRIISEFTHYVIEKHSGAKVLWGGDEEEDYAEFIPGAVRAKDIIGKCVINLY